MINRSKCIDCFSIYWNSQIWLIVFNSKEAALGKGRGSGVWPSMVTHTQNLCSAFNPSKCTHSSEHTPGAVGSQCCGARGAVGGLVPCSRVSPQSWYWRWRECWLFTPPTYNPCRTWDSNPRPSGYKYDSRSIRPRLPFDISDAKCHQFKTEAQSFCPMDLFLFHRRKKIMLKRHD